MHSHIFIDLIHEKWSVTYVCIRCKAVAHLNDVDILPFHSEFDSDLASCKTSAEHHHVISYLIFLKKIIVDDYNIVSFESRDRRYERSRACSDYKCIRCFCFNILFGDSSVEADLYAQITCELFVCSSQLIHIIFERECLLSSEDPAYFIILLTEYDLMATLCSSDGSIQTSRSCSCYKDFFLYCRRNNFHAISLSADERIDRALACARYSSFSHACEAAQAVYYVFTSSLNYLARKLMVSEQLACHLYHICLAGRNYLFHHLRVGKASDSRYRNAYVLLDLSCKIDVAAVIFEHRWVCYTESLLVSSCSYMKQIDIRLYRLSDSYSFVKVVSVRHEFRSAEPELDRESRADSLSYLL